MTLRWKSFERGTWRKVRAELRSSKVRWKEYKQERKARRWRGTVGPWFLRLLVPLWFGIFLFGRWRQPDDVIVFITLWTLSWVFLRAAFIYEGLYYSPSLHVYNHVPVGDDVIFRAQTRQAFRNSLWSILDFAVLYGILANRLHASNLLATAVGFGLVHWLIVMAAAVCLMGYGPRRALAVVGVLLWIGSMGLVLIDFRNPAFLAWMREASQWVPPIGWASHAFGLGSARGILLDMVPAVMTALILAAVPTAWRRIRGEYVLTEAVFQGERQQTAAQQAQAMQLPKPTEAQEQPEAEVTSAVLAGTALRGFDWQSARPVERLAASVLSRREQTIVEFLVAAQPQWSSRLRNLVVAVIIGVVASWATGGAAAFLLFFAAAFLLGLFMDWRGFNPALGGGVQAPVCAFHPITFWELLKAILKVHALKLVCCVPIYAACVAVWVSFLHHGRHAMTENVVWAFQILYLAFIAQPLLAVGIITGMSGVPIRFMRMIYVVAVMAPLAACVIFFLTTSSPRIMIFSGVGMAAISAVAVWMCARWYNWGNLDLLVQPATAAAGSPQ